MAIAYQGVVGLVEASGARDQPAVILILLLAAFETYRRWKQRKAGGDEALAYYRVKPAHRVAILAVYLGLIVVCVVGMGLTFVEREIPA